MLKRSSLRAKRAESENLATHTRGRSTLSFRIERTTAHQPRTARDHQSSSCHDHANQRYEDSEHNERLEEVLRCLDQANLLLNIKKCSFGASKILLLGHEISKEGIRPDPAKTNSICDFPTPTDQKATSQPERAVIKPATNRITEQRNGHQSRRVLYEIVGSLIENRVGSSLPGDYVRPQWTEIQLNSGSPRA